jgi:hypothetical protein
VTVKERARRIVMIADGPTAAQVARMIGSKKGYWGYGTVSSALFRLVGEGALSRRLGKSARYSTGNWAKKTWHYFPPKRRRAA